MQDKLIKKANEMLERAYVPYSNFPVGAALLTEEGEVYGGCNIENASYPMTNCAERTAFFAAVADGNQKFKAIAVTSHAHIATSPCGACRQVMSEFCDADMPVYLTNKEGSETIETTVGELLPRSFKEEDMNL